MASIAVLPVLLGLGVDYAIQYQARVVEEGGPPVRAARVAVPVIATAALATGVGLPRAAAVAGADGARVRRCCSWPASRSRFALALTAGTAALALARAAARRRAGAVAARRRRAGRGRGDAARRARSARPARRVGGAAVRAALRRPGRVLAVGLAVAALGWAVDSRTEVVSDIERLVPQDLPAVQDLEALQQATGVAGEIDVVVEGDDLTEPAVVQVDARLPGGRAQALRLLGRPRLRAGRAVPGAVAARTCSATQASASDRERIRALLDAVPPYFSSAVITARPQDGEPRVRDPAGVARAPAADHR